jgi:hypothetical protein
MPRVVYHKKMTMSLVAAGAVSFAAMGVDAGGPVALTDSQLDRVNAGDTPPVFAGSAAAAAGLGLRVFGGTQTTAVTVIGSPGNDGPFGGSTAQAGAYAFGGGLNGVSPGSGAANATTATEAPGNLTVHIGMNYTVYGIGTVAQGSISSSTGLFVPGLP